MFDDANWNLKLDNFYGPLDVLYDLIKKNHMSILHLNLTLITEQYLDYVQTLKQNAKTHIHLDEISEYLVLAQNLIHLKSKYVILQLQKTNENEINAIWNEEYLTQLLLKVEQYKQAMQALREKQTERLLFFTKKPDSFDTCIPADLNLEKLPQKINPEILWKYFQDVQTLVKENENVQNYELHEISVSLLQEQILQYLQIHSSCNFLELLKELIQKEHNYIYFFVSLFLAILLLCNASKISLREENENIFITLN